MSSLLMQYGPVCKLIAGLLPGQVEVVLHDMKTNKIAAIEGGFSNRDIGDESLIDIQDLAKDVDGIDVLGPYPQQNWDGETLRSFTAVLRDENGDCIGLLCVNCRTSAFVAAAEALSAFTLAPVVPQPESLFSKDWREAANRIMAQTLSEKGLTLVTAKRVDKVDLLRRLDQSGILKMRGAIDHVVKSVGMSRAGIYNLLRDARKTQENSTSEAA